MDTSAPKPKARWPRVVAINLALLLAGLLVAEAVFGGWFFGRDYGALVVPRNVARQFDVQGLYGGGTSQYRRDGHGLRGTYADPGAIDILAIGGSTTNELFITEGRTWTDVLAQTLTQAGRPTTVVNAGVDGQSTVGNIKDFELWFPRIPGLKPRFVLVYTGVNDLALARSGHLAKQDHMVNQRRQLKQVLMNNSALYTAFRNIRGMLRARRADLVHGAVSYAGATWVPVEAPPVPDPALAPELDAYADRLETLIGHIRALGAKAILVTQHKGGYRIREGRLYGRQQPDGTVDTGDYADLMAQGALCIDLASDLAFGDGDFYDGLHTTPQGSARIGRYLAEKLRPVVE